MVTLDVKPWDDETDMAELEKAVRAIEMPGLLWGSSKLVAIGYGIKKLQITLVIGKSSCLESIVTHSLTQTRSKSEDELVSLDELQEKIAEAEDYVQSTDVAAMQSTYLTLALICRMRNISPDHLRRALGYSSDMLRSGYRALNFEKKKHSIYCLNG